MTDDSNTTPATLRSILVSLCVAGGADAGRLTFHGGNKDGKELKYRKPPEGESELHKHTLHLPFEGNRSATLTLYREKPFDQHHLKILNYLLEQKHIDLPGTLDKPQTARLQPPEMEDQLAFLEGLNTCFQDEMGHYSAATQSHSQRVGSLFHAYITQIQKDGSSQNPFRDTPLGQLNSQQVKMLHLLGDLHDLGKLYVPKEILEATRILHDHEWVSMRQHPHISGQILALANPVASPRLHAAPLIAGSHHMHDKPPDKEKPKQIENNGRRKNTPYPYYTNGDSKDSTLRTPFESKIMVICDQFEAMTAQRSYHGAQDDPNTRNRRSPAKALGILLDEALQNEINPLAFEYFLQKKIYNAILDKKQQPETDQTAQKILDGSYTADTLPDGWKKILEDKVAAVKEALKQERFAVAEIKAKEAVLCV